MRARPSKEGGREGGPVSTCPVNTEGGTRRVQLVREGGGRRDAHDGMHGAVVRGRPLGDARDAVLPAAKAPARLRARSCHVRRRRSSTRGRVKQPSGGECSLRAAQARTIARSVPAQKIAAIRRSSPLRADPCIAARSDRPLAHEQPRLRESPQRIGPHRASRGHRAEGRGFGTIATRQRRAGGRSYPKRAALHAASAARRQRGARLPSARPTKSTSRGAPPRPILKVPVQRGTMPSAGSRALRGPACAPRPAPATATTQTPPSVCSRGISLNLFGSSQARCGGQVCRFVRTSLPLRSLGAHLAASGELGCRAFRQAIGSPGACRESAPRSQRGARGGPHAPRGARRCDRGVATDAAPGVQRRLHAAQPALRRPCARRGAATGERSGEVVPGPGRVALQGARRAGEGEGRGAAQCAAPRDRVEPAGPRVREAGPCLPGRREGASGLVHGTATGAIPPRDRPDQPRPLRQTPGPCDCEQSRPRQGRMGSAGCTR